MVRPVVVWDVVCDARGVANASMAGYATFSPVGPRSAFPAYLKPAPGRPFCDLYAKEGIP